MTFDLEGGLTAMHARLAILAAEQPTTTAFEELRLIRARLREVAADRVDE
jgi:hypothetical protein